MTGNCLALLRCGSDTIKSMRLLSATACLVGLVGVSLVINWANRSGFTSSKLSVSSGPVVSKLIGKAVSCNNVQRWPTVRVSSSLVNTKDEG